MGAEIPCVQNHFPCYAARNSGIMAQTPDIEVILKVKGRGSDWTCSGWHIRTD
jgi:hypothetical protein